jgi:folate-binding protein YgfZ
MKRLGMVVAGDPRSITNTQRNDHCDQPQRYSNDSDEAQQGYSRLKARPRTYNTAMNVSVLQPVFDESGVLPFAQACGAGVVLDEYGLQLIPREAQASSQSIFEAGAVAPVSELGLLRCEGDDALTFLQGQLTNDVLSLAPGQSQLNGYCSAKGRLLASMRVWRDEKGVMLLTSRALAPPLAKRLGMFVLRARAKFSLQADSWACFGLAGSRAAAPVGALGGAWPGPRAVLEFASCRILGIEPAVVRDKEIARALLLCPIDQAATVWKQLSSVLTPISSIDWRWGDVMSGIAQITPAGVERFVPQMVNFDLVGGVSFKKGCYPGQEVVARSHYLGKLKRRTFLAELDGEPPRAGEDVFDKDSQEPCGQIVSAARSGDGSSVVLIESQIAQAGQAALADGRTLNSLPLPYDVPAG